MSDGPNRRKISSYVDIDGWFTPVDRFVFDAVLANQADLGTVVELGAYLGRSAVIIAEHVRPGERFVVVDLFGSDNGLGDSDDDDANRRENAQSYTTLNRAQFERNFLALRRELPEVVQGLSSVVSEYVADGTARFVHIDASHLYGKVTEDIATAARLIQPQGVVVLDDYRSPHTPGVAAATWEAVREGGLKPFVITPHKLYGTWGDPRPYRELVARLAQADPKLAVGEQTLREHTIVRIFVPKSPHRTPAPKPAEPVARAKPPAESATRRTTLVHDWTPPAVARWAHKHRTNCSTSS